LSSDDERAPAFGWRIGRFGAIASTSDEARRRALAGDPGKLWIVAEAQTAGRGRRGRVWVSPAGNLHASALLVDPCPQARATELGFVAGVAIVRSARDLATRARLKWPNDLILDGGKCAGLLVEGLQLPRGGFACIVGFGVNCASAPEAVGYPTATLIDSAGGKILADDLFVRLRTRFAEALETWQGAGFSAIREAWLAHAGPVGERIRVSTQRDRREGLFEGLDVDGRLLFRGKGGIETIETADLWILPAPDDPPVADVSALAGERA